MIETRSDLDKLASGAGVSLVGKFTGKFIGVIGDILAARILGPEVFGLYAIGWTILRVVGLFSPLGLDKGILRFGAKNIVEQDHSSLKGTIIGSLGIAILFSTILCVLFLFLSPWLANDLFRKPQLVYIFRLVALAFPSITLVSILEATTRLKGNVKYSVAIQDIGQPIIALLLLGIFYIMGFRLRAVLFSDVFSFLIAASVGILFIARLFPVVFQSNIKAKFYIPKLFLFSFPTALAGVFSTFLFWVDRLIIGYFRPAAEGGIYQAVSQASTVFAFILGGFNTIVLPMLSDLIQKGEQDRLQKVFRASTKWGLYLSMPIFIMFVVFSSDILRALFGGDYASGWGVLLLLSIGQLVNVGTGAVGLLLVLAGLQNSWLALSSAAFAFNVIMNLLLVPRFGIGGAAISTSIAVTMLFVSAIYVSTQVLKITPYDRTYFKGFVSAVITVLIILPFHAIRLQPLYTIILGSAVSLISFFTLLSIFRLNEEDKEFLNGIWLRIKKLRIL